jgi:hypothetical protein
LAVASGLLGPNLSSADHFKLFPGALSYTHQEGAVLYNLLSPHMQQFMGRCVGAIKKAGIAAKGTGQFSILVGERGSELSLDKFY